MALPTHADAIEDLPPAVLGPAPLHARAGGKEASRRMGTIPTARVNLMPPEVQVGRRIRRIKRRIIVAVVMIVVASAAGLGWFKLDASEAGSGLAAEQAAVAALRAEQQTYADLLRVDLVAKEIDKSLTSVMGDDVLWDQCLVALSESTPAGVTITGVTVALNDITDAAAGDVPVGSGSLDGSGEEHLGSLTITGLAPSHAVVAAWSDSLTDVPGFLVPYVVLEGVVGIEFTIEVTLSSEIRSLRYEPTAATDGQGG